MQTSQEVVKAAIEFTVPERLPLIFDRFGHGDVHSVKWNQPGPGDRTKRETYDEWGCGWVRMGADTMGQVKLHPLADWAMLSGLRWPDPDTPAFYEGIDEKFIYAQDRYITTGIFMLLFERLQALRGFESVLTDLYLEQERLAGLADRVVAYDIRIIENIAARYPGRIDGFTFTDDWGTETALMIHPDMWRAFFKPRYKRIFDACHRAGWHVWMHSCGMVNDIIGDLIEIGCDVINLQQPRLLGIRAVGEQFAGKICFQAACDIQHTLPLESIPYIEAEAQSLLECWGTDHGGFILSDYGSDVAIGTTPEKTRAMMEAFLRHDRWRNQREAGA